jgi:S-DNA-T family DNA segregation ATPase FtsK/SpoIIIE
MELLEDGDKETVESRENVRNAGIQLLNVLREFSIEAKLSNIITGPVVTRYELIPPKGLKINKIVALADNIALGIAAYDKIRIEAPIPGKSAVGIEVPNQQRQLVSFKDLISNEHFKPQKSHLPFTLGKAISGKPYYTDIGKIPHLLIAGSTGSGKSVCVNSLICSILYSKKPDEVRLMLVDPKRVELKMYEELPHLITPVMKETHEAITALNWAVKHMEERYRILESYNVRSISGYNIMRKQENKSTMPYIVIIIDEFADLIMTGRKEIEEPIIRLAQMSRAVGIHLVLATQRPSADVITNLIKANFPGRIAFKVATKLESRIILDINGAETLLGKGDMLYTSPNMSNISRLQSPFISDEEVFRITQFYKKHYKSDYWDEVLEEMQCETEGEAMDPSEEPLFNEAVDIVVREKKASASYLQRRLKIGYNRAARIVEMMEDMGIVGPQSGSKPRDVLIDSW